MKEMDGCIQVRTKLCEHQHDVYMQSISIDWYVFVAVPERESNRRNHAPAPSLEHANSTPSDTDGWAMAPCEIEA